MLLNEKYRCCNLSNCKHILVKTFYVNRFATSVILINYLNTHYEQQMDELKPANFPCAILSESEITMETENSVLVDLLPTAFVAGTSTK